MLVLSHSDRFGVYFHQFGQRIHQSAAYGYGSTHGHVVFRELVSGGFRGRVNGCSVLAYYKYLQFTVIAL